MADIAKHRDHVVRTFGPAALPPRKPALPSSAQGFEPIPAFLRRGPERLRLPNDDRREQALAKLSEHLDRLDNPTLIDNLRVRATRWIESALRWAGVFLAAVWLYIGLLAFGGAS